jgi:predicted enzyme related to lactoylglutathione lyase
MQVVKSYPNGLFCWVDLATTDLEAAKTFYTGLFGWTFEDLPIDDVGSVYTMFQIEGHNVAAGNAMDPDTQAQGVPPFWSSYIKHDDVDAVAAKISAAGGTVMFPPMDVMEAGRMTVAQDPTGAMFGVWQPGSHIGADLVNIPNTLSWNELQTRDSEAALAFYSQVFGWAHDVDPTGYITFKQDGRIHAGMMQMDESWGDIPSNWTVYFAVEDIEATAAKAKELGGNILVPPTSAGEVGTFSVIQDPQGGAFTAIQLNNPGDPPPGY